MLLYDIVTFELILCALNPVNFNIFPSEFTFLLRRGKIISDSTVVFKTALLRLNPQWLG